ncbi:non-ribosomal peptide synthase/polyketide synthase [Nostoc sp.]|uniref:non-ribosomal peptide synthase/polyketide synthase n=1 Tax=Nostoc sp. TaxID=1180 RepID=UPI003FA5FB77
MIVKTSYPLSSGQEAMWFIYQIAPESVAYNIFITVKINSYLNINSVNRVWEKIIENHPILRTTYTSHEGKSVQEINQQHNFNLEVTDASNWSEDYLKEKIFAIADRPFNLEKDPVLRVNLFTQSTEEHILLLTMHHIAGDMWSFDLLLSQFQALYAEEIEQISLQQTETAIDDLTNNKSYLDLVRWQSEMLSSSRGEKHRQYWQEQLAGELPILNLLADKPRPTVQTYQGTAHISKLDKELIQKLQYLAQTSGTTLYQILLTAFYVQLYRYTNQKDILIGSPMRGRWSGDFKDIVGYFVNLTVLRTAIEENATFTEFLAQVSDTVKTAQTHQDYPFSLLAKQLQPQRDPSRSPLCQVSFTWQPQRWCERTEKSLHSGEQVLQMEPYLLGHQRGADFDLNLMVMEAQEVFQLCWQYNTDLFEATTISRMAGHFVTLLEGIAANPQQQIWQLPLLKEVEQQQLLVEWNDTGVDYPQDKCIHQLFEEQVERTPDAVAVVFENQQLTYQELNYRANQLAHHLKSLGVGADVLVGLCVERSLEMVVGLLGILKAGGAYVPLDPNYPQQRLTVILDDAALPLLLTQQSLLESLPEHTAQVVCFDSDRQLIAQHSPENPLSGNKPENLAYVIYTSGSTGKPKGVQVNHNCVVNFLASMSLCPGLTDSDTFCAITTISFDIAVLELYLPLIVGAKLVVVSREVAGDGARLLLELQQSGTTVMQATPVTWQMLLASGLSTQQLGMKLLCGGEALPDQLAHQLLETGSEVWNLYGPTETTIWSSIYQLRNESTQLEARSIITPIGRPIANTQIYILDTQLQLVPLGVPGELHIGGAGLARGYLNRPELTQEKFIPNPFGEVGASRLYKTGDLARYRPDGNIEYLGRIDNQVKIRGFRIELGEIEAVLSQHNDVETSCAIAPDDIYGNKRLIAYIVPHQHCTPSISELRQFIKAKLPDYMVPNAFVMLEEMPLTPNGKIDRRALPAPELHSQSSDRYIVPRTPVEEMLAQIWVQVLKVEQIGIDDNFFELGGHSLLATQLVSRIRNVFKVELQLRNLFAATTVAQLARLIGQLQQQNLELSASPILPRAENAELALSYAQQRLWFLDQFEPNSALYNIPIALRLVGSLKVTALEQSLEEIIIRHEALRTNFITIDGKASQIIQKQINCSLSIVDLKHLSTSEQQIASQQLAQQQAIQPFELATQVLVRATLVILSETEQLLFVCMHHIVSDGWSMGVFVQELAALYNAYSQGKNSPLAPLPIQYADFALWQRQWLQGEVLQSQLSYWQQQLADAPALLSLPTDRSRPAVQTFTGAHQEFALSQKLTGELTQLSQQQGVTLFMTLLAAYDILLHRYTGVADILVGTPIANRNSSEIEGIIGFFVNTLIIRTDVFSDRSFNELLVRIREVCLGAYTHQDLPFEMLVEALQPQRDLSYNPLFQVMFALQNASISEVELTGLSVTSLPIESATAKFDLTLSMENTANGLVGVWEYNTDLFDSSTIERMTGHFVTLLEAIVSNPIQPISQLPLLTEVEQQQLLVEWNNTQADYPQDLCIHQLFESQVERISDAVAVIFENQQLTYAELNSRANQLAHYLQTLGVKPDVLVGICVERSLEMIVGILGILKAGGAYLPLDPEYPAERLSFMLEDAQVTVLLTQDKLLEKLPGHKGQVVCLDTDWQLISQSTQDNAIALVQASNLAYVIYTSGSTGKPKGVTISHGAIASHCCIIQQAYELVQSDRVLQFASINFDASLEQIFPTLIAGATLVLRGSDVWTPTNFQKIISDFGLTVVNLPTAYWQQLAQESAKTKILDDANSQLRLVIVGGDVMLPEYVALWQQSPMSGVRLLNAYGPTEATITATLFEIPPQFSKDTNQKKVPIGCPLPNKTVYILDEHLQPVPIGIAGELHFGGVALAQGYLNRPELTQEKFIPNPFDKSKVKSQKSKLYKTGDLARYLPDGNIEYLGRIDNQVKIRGFRIELGEIEAVLSEYPHLQTSCVIAREDIPGNKSLVTYIVSQKEQTLIINDLRCFLKSKLPEYMVPSAIVILDALPLTPGGKIDRRALPAPDLHSQLLDKYVAPRSPNEELLTQIWAYVLKVEQVGIYDNFFELGGHSLLATQLVSRIRNIFKVELPLRELFAAPTVAELAHLIGQLQQQNSEQFAPPILPRAENAELTLSYAQQRLWFLDQFEPDSPFYNMPLALHLAGTVQVAALEQSLQEIIIRHEALRTNFITVDGKPTQIIQTESTWIVSVVDLKHLSITEQEIATEELAQQQAIQPFNLANQALVRATLVVQSETEHILLMCMHHIVSDGWSMGVFVQELVALYNAYSQGQTSPLAPLPIQYADFALWQRQWLQGEVLQSQLTYWQKQLASAPALLSLPTDRPRPVVQTYNGTHQYFALSEELTSKLTKLSQEQGVTLFMTLLAAYDTLIYRYTGTEDILVGSPIANRDRTEIEGLIGFFVNTLVMRTDVSGNPSFSELLGRVRDMAMQAYSHQNLPFEMLVEALQPERDLSYTPLFQVMFVLQNAPMSQLELTGLTVRELPIKGITSRFDLTLIMQNTANGMVGLWEYNTDLFDSSTIERMTSHFVTLLESIITNPEQQISQLPLLKEVEQQQLLVEWNATQVDYPLHKCIPELFEEEVERTPNAVAVEFENQQLTYQELNNRANQLANHLRSLGVVADTLVGLCVERSLEMVIGLLGILKAGAAYVPLDPEYPTERLSFILEDTQASVLLTQQSVLDRLPSNQAKLVCLDTDAGLISQCSQDNLISGVEAHNLVYIIYTSGSTGQPKGIAMSHIALCNHVLWHGENLKIARGAKTLQFASISFDVSFQEIFTTWCSGGTLFLIGEELRQDASALLGFLQEKAIERMFLAFVGLQQLAEVAVGSELVNNHLREIITSGEQLQITPAISQWFSKLTDCTLHNQYGPSESHLASSFILNNSVETWPLLPYIGRPIANTQIYILDRFLQPVPIGVPGELYIAGVLLAQGYFNRRELTQEKFILNPFSDEPDSRLYKTGDLGRYLPDGNIESLGRIDNQVKIRGFRIELGEIEAVLSQIGDVQASCAIAREDIPGNKYLAAYVVPQKEQTLTVSVVRGFLKSKLPEYMVPSAIVILEALPLTPNGKLDRRALPVPDLHSQLLDKYVAARNPIEEILSLIWTQVLKVELVGIHDNFFELGGHSLLATQLISRVRTSLKVELPLRSLFAAPTVAQLSEHIQRSQQQDLELTAPPILPRAKNAELPLSFAQTRLWFLEQLNPNSAFYNLLIALRLVGTLNVAILEQSLIEILHRHEALRTNFAIADGEPSQVIQTQTNWTVSVVDLQHLPTSEQKIASQQLAQQQAIQPFELATQPLVRATLVVLSETEHLLLVCMHHIVSDGWSMGVFVQELAALYNAYFQGQPTPLEPLPIQYADFALWQRQWFQGDVLQSQLSYWQKQLKDSPALLSLPTDRPRPAVQTFAGAYQHFAISQELTTKLTKLSQQEGCTLFMTLLAAYDTLLHRYTGVADILIGSPIANRNRGEIEGLIGFFVNTLVMRTDLSGNPSFSELLTRVREMALGAYAHQDLPFEMLVEALQPERNLSHTPLFQVMFVLQNVPMSQVELTGLTVNPLLVESATSKFDLTLAMENTAAGLAGVLEYNTALFDRSTIARMADHFVTLLEAIVANPQERISQLPMLTAVEQQQLLVEWNNTQVDYPQDKCIHQLFEEQVELTPDAVAVVFENEQLTYAELNSRANQLAHYLRSLGVKADVLVGICVERSLEMVVGLLGILKAGGAYLPLDPEYPTERLHFILRDAQVSVLLTQQQLVDKLPPNQESIVCLDTDAQVISLSSQENLITASKASNLAYVIYTSGSTGQPKGVLVTHYALLNLVFWHNKAFEITALDKATQVASTAFDAAVWELWPYLTAGASIYLLKPGIIASPVDLQDWLRSQNITISFLPTPVAEQLLSLEWTENSALRTLLTGGDKLHRYPSSLLPFQVVNNYGPTENTVVTTSGIVVSDGVSDNISPSIGRPIANTQIYILDEYLQPVPVGVPGELHIGGASLAQGYLNRPELTQEKFISNPFSDEPHSRLYKTGDLSRYLLNGSIEYLGRIDNQVKIRGFRIELGEIEAALNQNIHVQTSCVIAREDIPGDTSTPLSTSKRLVAYVALHQHSTLAISELRHYLKAKLPHYMMPQAFVVLEEMPLTPNGKVDRRALPAPDLDHELKDKYVAPRTPSEDMLAQIWATVLKVEQVGIYDNFFELGGHSLLATQLVSRIRSNFQVELPLRELFATATVAELAQSIQELQQQKLQLTAPPILPRLRDAELPLSYSQTRLWFLDQFDPNSAFYNIPIALRLVGSLNKTALEQSLEEIIHRHEALRTNFITIDGKPSQIIQTETNWTVSVVDWKHLSATEQEIATQQLAQQQAIQPFELATQALVRATLVILSETEHILLMCMHHIVSDGWSMGVFVQELAALYSAYSQGQTSPLAPLPIQYADFALWQRQWLQGDILQKQLSYWEKQLADAPALLSLPTDRPRPAVQTFAGANQQFELSIELTSKLTKLSQEQGVTLFMTLLAAFDTLLYRYTEQSDILVGTPIANRNRGEIEGLIGFFVNTLVLRTDLSGNPSFSELLTRVRQMAMEAYSHQDLPFEMLVETLQPERDLSHAPLFQVDFLLQNDPLSEVELTGLNVTSLPIESATAKFDLTLAMAIAPTGMVGVWEYNTDLFDASTIARMAGHFVTLLEAIVENPQQQISQLPMLTDVEQRQLFVGWNDTQADYPEDLCIHQLFESQVEHTPNAIAVVFENQQLTYGELNTQANQLAHYLQTVGVGPEVLVGIYLERSLSVIVGLLAVLKAGGGYVPLDPDYPQQRLADISQDSQFSVLITEQKLLNSLPVQDVKIIVLDTESGMLTNQSQENPVSEVEPENLACILYTSGSTGKPKGVMLAHEALVNHSSAISEVFGLTSCDRVLQFASFSFDVAAEEIFPTWLKGATVVLRPMQMFSDFASLAQFIEQQKLSVLNITPAYWHEWAVAVSKSDATVPQSLRLVAVGGDAVLPETVTLWQQLVGDRVNCLNVYGPTEASVTAIVHDLLHPKSEKTNSVLIGRPIANTQAYILDRHLQPVPIGVRGELHIGGVRLARGYLNLKELTDEKFIPNPFEQSGGRSQEEKDSSFFSPSPIASPQSLVPSPRLYKTGDLARYLPDGNIECFGRIDNQVKIRGFRIELGEIEAVLNQHSHVQTSCVIIREDAIGDKRLVAYVVPYHEQIPPISELRQFLSNRLPLYMVPNTFVVLESLPLTPNRKVDRRALPAPDLYSEFKDKYVAPRTPNEEMLAQIWAQVLKVEQVGIHDNFFEIGGHSLLATQLVSRIRNIFKIELPLRSLFAAATVAQLAHLIGELQQQNLEIIVPPILPRAENAELSLSYAQQRLWFLDQLQPNSALYNIPIALRLAGTLNVAALEESLREIIYRHEALRTNFVTVDGKASQVIQIQTNWTISVVELQHLPTSEKERASQQLVQQQTIQPFDLKSASLLRATLVVLNETEHLLLVCMHHIVSDEWSMGVFVQELAALYNAYSQGQTSPLAPLPIQYADFAIWQRQWLQGDVLQSQLSYWQQQLKDAPALLSLPTDRTRPAVQTFAGAYQEFALSEELTSKLTQLSQQQGCTLFMTLLAAFDTLLYRYTGVADILVGTPIANRNCSEVEGLIGFFVNTLVMRTDLSENPSFSELLTRVREMALSAYAHQDLPFEMLVEVLQPQRNLSHTPLFQVAFLFQNAPVSQVELTGLTISDLPTENVSAKFDLTLAIANTATGLAGILEYNIDLFDRSTIARMADHFVTLLEAIVANPQERISQLPMLTTVEQQQLLVEWNNTQVDYPQDKCIHQLFEEQVELTPDAVAVVFENEQLTYAELNSRANQLAHYLRSLGVKADVLVGICVERSLEMVVGLLGILKAGGAYLPLDPEYPTERLHFILRDAQVSVLLTQQQLVDKLPPNQESIVCLDTDAQVISLSSQENLITASKASNLAYVIYTSGSTGQPKGVLVTHYALLNLVFWHNKAFEITALDKATQVASTAFDAAVWELWPYLTAGASIYLLKPGIIASPVDLQDWLRSQNITISFLPTPVAEQLLSLEWTENSALRTLLTGGDKLHRYPSSLLPFQVVNNYGPTENTVVTTSGIVVSDGVSDNISPSIGRPIANTQIYILDEYLQPVPVGVPGELHIGGASLAQGYLNRPELTQEKFISNPFSDEPHSRLYKTGDLSRYLLNGSIEYLGRIDNQVKIRGFRIELGEIEAVLSQLPEVQEVVVVAQEDQLNNKRLVAYVVPQQKNGNQKNHHPDNLAQSLRANLKKLLPSYMIPSSFVLLENLPLTPNGKIDHRALPTHELNEAYYVMPNTEAEKIIAAIWQKALQVEKVGLYDNFFEIGGHSLIATQVISRLQEAFGTSLPLRHIFESPTVSQLSEAILAQLETGSGLAVPAMATPRAGIAPVSRDADIPLSWAQERLWFVNQLEGESGAYTIDFTLRLLGNLNVKALEQAFAKIVQRHEVLRTHFEIRNNQPVQVIDPNMTITLPVVDLQNLPDPWKQVEQLATAEACKPFDLANGPVLRVKLWQVAEDEYVLLFAIHHIAADGWSMGVLIGELSAYYRSFSTGSSVELPELPIQYADFAVWQRQWFTNQVLERQLSYWKQHLTGAPPLLELPTDRPRPAIQTFRGGTEQLKLDALLTQQLKKLSQESGSTLFMTLLAGFVVLLSRYSGQTDLVVGSPIANRNRIEIEELIGFFVNSLALRFDLSQEPTFEALLAQVRKVTQNAYDHQDLPFEMLVEELQLERNLDRNPLTQVVFALQNAPSAPWDLPDLKVEGMPSGLDSVRLDLEVYLWDAPEGLSGFCSYNRDLFDAATIARMMQHFVTLLTAIVANPQQPVALMPLLTQQERHQLLVEWNDTQADYPQDLCIHQLFESQVERTPDAVAVVFENEQLTYHELNCRANQLAHYLRSLGVGADVLVGLCVERSLLMAIGLLAILKAGGAYVPLDPEYPQDRLSFMLEDAQVWVLLTQQHLFEKLPPNQANTVFLDEIWSEIAQNSQDNFSNGVTASHLANVIYTSGSTGKPKGVMVEHSGLCNLAQAQIKAFGVDCDSRVLQFASFSFDACISEILMTWASGSTLYLGTKDSLMPGAPLIERLRDYGITHVILPPSALAVLPEEELPALQTIIVAGEACSAELIRQWSVDRSFLNAYGPTEASVCATVAKCTPFDEKVTIGRPIANKQIYILDSHLQPVPIGVPGELHIGGVGLARGYLNRLELTQEKFIPNPFEEVGRSRLYKTGDLARYLPDGNIEYLGRIDNQVKVRGFRIELGEIEAVLSQHPFIQEGVVVAIDNTGDKQLTAYLVPALKNKVLPQQVAQWQSEYVSDWQTLYEQAYGQPQASIDDPTFNISGWNSSYTKEAIPALEMQEWVESTVDRILSLSPQQVLEIGCGTGLLLSRVAKHCKYYWGCDYSSAAIQHVEQVCKTVEGLENVRLLHQMADDFTLIPKGEFDTVVINSVVQYFPSVEYLLQVIEGAIAAIGKSGTLFVGDVRSKPLLEPYHAAVQLSQATEERTVEQWQQQVHSSVAAEEELVIDPSFFIALQTQFPQITWVEIQPKRGNSQNELTQFRYDVTLHLGTDVQTKVVPWLNWQLDKLSLAQIQNQLHKEQPELLGIRGVPNQRVQQALQICQWLENSPGVETVGQLRLLLAKQPAAGINPEEFYQLGQHLGYTVHMSWWESSQDGAFDVVFCRNQEQKAIAFWDNSKVTTKPWTDYTNNPLYGKLVQKLVPQVREFIQQKLPNYMVPQAFVLLNALPLTPNGKVDRRALPAPDTATRNLATGFVSPRTPIEAQLIQIWSEVLGTERIGINDNFFELGGHSLLATQVISRLRNIFSVELSLQNFLEYPTVANLAQIIEVVSTAQDGQLSIKKTQEDYEEGEL